MIKSITVKNYLDESIEFILTNPEKSGFYVKEVEGLGPPIANINLTEVSTNDGGIYNSARAISRNIVFTLGFLQQQENEELEQERRTIEDVRHLSYKYFPIKKKVTIIVETDNRIVETYGFVEKNEPIIFSQRQTTQVSILCPDPFFYSQDQMVTLFLAVVPMFEFPFSNESLTENMLIMGEIWPRETRSIYYEGDAEVGVVMHIFARSEASNVTIFNPETNQRMTINNDRLRQLTGSGIVNGDHIIISTVRGDKHITLIRRGISYNILNALNRDAYWFQLSKGDNIFAYTAEYGLSWIDFRIENRIVYAGV